MKKKDVHFVKWLTLRPTVVLILLALILDVSLSLFFQYAIVPWYENSFGPVGGVHDYNLPLDSLFVLSVFLVPFIETLVFQLLVIYLLQRFTRFPLWVIVCVSALLFASIHTYSALYIIFAFLSGLTLAIVFIACQQKRDYFFAFLIVMLIHAIYNFIAFLLNDVFSVFA